MSTEKHVASYANLKVKQAKFQASNIKLFQGDLRFKGGIGFNPKN
jgi:hypothetical protein